MTREHVTVDRTGAVGRIVMDRAEQNNAMNRRMADEMRNAAIELAEDDDIRCLVFTGTDGVFNTGADLTTFDGDETDGKHLKHLAGRLHETVTQLVRARKPVICAVNGVAAGGGVGPALCGDIVLMSEQARFQFAYPRIGLSADGGSTFFLPRLVGLREAQRIAFRDEPVGPAEAAELGLVTETVPEGTFDDVVAQEAQRLAAGPTKAYAETSALLRTSFDHGMETQLAREAESISGLAATGDFARGIEAFLNKEDAEFKGE